MNICPIVEKIHFNKAKYVLFNKFFSDDYIFALKNEIIHLDKWYFAESSFYKQYEYVPQETLEYPAMSQLISENSKNTLKNIASELFGYDFIDIDFVFHKLERGHYIGKHTDKNPYGETHRLVIHFNDDWKDYYGGHFALFDENDEVSLVTVPMLNCGIMFEISDFTDHCVTECHKERYSLIITLKKKPRWTNVILQSDLEEAINTASYHGISKETFSKEPIIQTIKAQLLQLENVPKNNMYTMSSHAMNVDEYGIQSKGSDFDRISNITQCAFLPPIIVVKDTYNILGMCNGSHRLSYAASLNTDINIALYETQEIWTKYNKK